MKNLIVSLCFLFFVFSIYGQVGIGTIDLSPATMLEVSSTSDDGLTYKGFMPPRVPDEAARNSIAPLPADIGLLVFVENLQCLQIWNGTDWESVSCINNPPVATNVTFTGTLETGNTHTAGFDYNDVENDPEGLHIYTWYRATDISGTSKTLITSGTTDTYIPITADIGSYLAVEVTPVALTGVLTGIPVLSAYQGPIILPPEIWINEIHYDNVGTDIGEFIEIAGTVGLDLTNYTIELYRGDNGTRYDTASLFGTITGSNGIGFLAASYSNIIRDGDSGGDGIALINPSGEVIQFLSYEGTFEATDGNAFGIISTDIGVSEDGTAPAGESVQLKGTGNQYSDFTWTAPSVQSLGFINSGQIIN